jgi:hypothetical protein
LELEIVALRQLLVAPQLNPKISPKSKLSAVTLRALDKISVALTEPYDLALK